MAESTDENLYLLVAKELSINKRDEALWTMAFALENGDEAKTKAHYIRLRVAQLTSELSKSNTSARAADGTPNKQPSSPPQPDISVCWQRAADLPNSDQPDLQSDYAAVLGEKNLDYYLSKFAKFDDQESGIKASWNWAAFFFSGFWALYRKMYGWFAFFLLLGAIANALQRGMDRATPDLSGINGFVAHTLIYLLPQILFGIFANGLYWKKCKSKIQQARSTTRDEQRALMNMREIGGVLGWLPKVAITLAVVIPVLGIVLSILLPKVQRKDAVVATAPTTRAAVQCDTDDRLVPFSDEERQMGKGQMQKAALESDAEKGVVDSQQLIGSCYFLGNSFCVMDMTKAKYWFEKAAASGSQLAQYYLGNMYWGELGGVPKDAKKAFQLYKQAADSGHWAGHYGMGLMYQAGEVVPVDHQLAFQQFLKSAQSGCWPAAQLEVAESFYEGRGIKQNLVSAAAWAALVVRTTTPEPSDPSNIFSGLDYHSRGVKLLEKITPLLSAEERVEAQNLQRSWRK